MSLVRPTMCGSLGIPVGYAIQCRKSEHLTIIAAPDHVNNTAVYVENAKLPVCQTLKHFGLYVDKQLCWREEKKVGIKEKKRKENLKGKDRKKEEENKWKK